ncbi:MAG: 50S ribosomal protein L14e [Candidatus Hadarchaeales archaeon]
MEIGRVCVKIAGREAGEKCVIVDVLDRNFVVVIGPRVRKRRCNIAHLEPTDKKIDINKNTPDEEILKKLNDLGIR